MKKHTELVYIEPYNLYKAFIEECRKKIYQVDLVLHNHHILPKHLKTGIPDKENIVLLSVEDHKKAHLLLAECFTDGSYEKNSNLLAFNLLNKKSISDQETLKNVYIDMSGENNPFYGKKHSEGTRKKLSELTTKNKKNKSYEEYYGSEDKSNLEKEKRKNGVKKVWENRTDEEKNKIINKVKETKKLNGTILFGGRNPFAKKVSVNGKIYNSLAEAKKELNLSRFKLLKLKNFKYI